MSHSVRKSPRNSQIMTPEALCRGEPDLLLDAAGVLIGDEEIVGGPSLVDADIRILREARPDC